MTARRIAVVTGTRAEYGLLKTAMRAIESTKGLELQTVVTGMHLSPQFGHTVEEVASEFDVDAKVDTLLDGDTGLSMAKSLGTGVSGLAETFRHLEPDVVLVLGDRGEAFAAGVAASHMTIPVAHVHGGDAMTGATIDDSIRHALTKFAHVHFPATTASAERVRKLGEESWRITPVGAPGLDRVLAGEYEPPREALDALGFDRERPLALVVQHPLTTAPDEAGEQFEETLDAFDGLDVQVLLVYPNADAGGREMIRVLESHPVYERITSVESLPRDRYLGVMAAADVMVGNSSSGIIEAPSFGLPVVNVGPRQEAREHADNLVQVPHETNEIRDAIVRCLDDEDVKERARACENPYEMGGAGERIAARLEEIRLDDDLLRKRLDFP